VETVPITGSVTVRMSVKVVVLFQHPVPRHQIVK